MEKKTKHNNVSMGIMCRVWEDDPDRQPLECLRVGFNAEHNTLRTFAVSQGYWFVWCFILTLSCVASKIETWVTWVLVIKHDNGKIPYLQSISQLAMFAKHNMVAPFGKPPPPKNSNVKHRCNSEHTKLAPARGGLLWSQHGIHDRRCLSASKRMRSRRCCHWGWKFLC